MQTHKNRKHKSKPTQFISVAEGVTKRIESNIEKKRKTRLTQFDNFRNLPQCESPAQEPLNNMQQKTLLLQKWKEERERKKKEAMANKKKPFVVGIVKKSLKYEPPPPMPWPLPISSDYVTRSQSRSHMTSDSQEKKIYKFAPENAAFNPTLKDLDIPSSSIFGQEKLEKNKAQEPRSLRSGTKVTDRIEGLLDGDVCDMSVEHFRRQLDSEIVRMTEMCETWDKILEQMTLPDEIQEAVLSAVGQARLLMSQKFQQFASLLRQSENPEPGHQLVTTNDLRGFWDMMFLQVENIDIHFKKLEESRARGWSVEEKPAAVARPRRPLKNEPAARVRPAPSNRWKDIITAARKAKQASMNEDTKTFDAGFFSVQSPVMSPRAAAPRRPPSLLQSVLSSEAKKSSAKNLYVVLRASMIGKNMDSGSESPCEANLYSLTPISNNNISNKVTGKQLHFALMTSLDTASDSSPIRDDGQISGVNFLDPVISPNLQDSDDLQHTSPRAHNTEKDQLKMPGASADDDEDNMAEDKKNKTDTENTTSPISNNNISTKVTGKQLHFALTTSLDTASDSSPIRDDGQISGVNFLDPVISPNLQDSDDLQHTSPRAHNTEKDQLKMPGASAEDDDDEDNMAEDTENTTLEDKENGWSSRRAIRLQRQDAVDIESPVKKTRSRRKMLEVNEEIFVITPDSVRARRRLKLLNK